MDRASAHNRNFAAALGTLAVLAYGVGLALQHFPLRLVAKPWPVLVLVWFLLQDGRHSYGQRIRWGLLACIAGDLLLEAGPATFLPAMAAFLVGHLSFITAFLERSRAPRLGLAIPSFGLGAAVLAWLWPGLEGSPLAVPVVIYTTVLCAMLWRGAAGLGSGRGGRLAAVGALLFVASDSLIALARFGPEPYAGWTALPYAIIALYWLAQWGIAASAWSWRPPDDRLPG